jgi:hypothetical protein
MGGRGGHVWGHKTRLLNGLTALSPRVTYRMFRGVLLTFDELFSSAAAFATTLGPGKVINISHSEDGNDGVVTVWYWDDSPPAPGEQRGPW